MKSVAASFSNASLIRTLALVSTARAIASGRSVCSEKFSIGPSNILLRLPPEDGNWTFGFFHQSVFSVAGEGNRKNVAQTQIQPIYWYSLPLEGIDTPWSVGGFPMININWEADNDNALTLPLEIAASATVFIGPMPVRLIFGINYWVVRADDYGPRYGLKFAIAPVIPRLVKNPILGFLQ